MKCWNGIFILNSSTVNFEKLFKQLLSFLPFKMFKVTRAVLVESILNYRIQNTTALTAQTWKYWTSPKYGSLKSFGINQKTSSVKKLCKDSNIFNIPQLFLPQAFKYVHRYWKYKILTLHSLDVKYKKENEFTVLRKHLNISRMHFSYTALDTTPLAYAVPHHTFVYRYRARFRFRKNPHTQIVNFTQR